MRSAAKRPATVHRRRALFREAAAIIDAEYPAKLALDDVARRVATSRRQLQRAFAEAGETSFRTYLQRVRMDRAAELLREGSASVNEVAERGRLPPAGPVREGLPPLSRRASVQLPRRRGDQLAA